MNKCPKVSIVYPIYNVSNYIEDSIKSVVGQTYKNFEVIAVNDGSHDDSIDIFKKIIEGKEIDYYIFNKENGGLASARNFGLKKARGEWVVFIDSDDVIHPNFLKTLVDDLITYDTDVSIGSYKKVTKDNLWLFESTDKGAKIDKNNFMKLMFSRNRFDAYCGCFLIRKDLLVDNNIFFNENVKFSVDQGFMWKVIDCSNSISVNYSKIYNYYLRPGSIMTSSKKDQILSGVNDYVDTINGLKNVPYDRKIIIDRWKMGILHSSAKLTDYGGFCNIKEEMKVDYFNCLRTPLLKIKILSSIGIISDKILYIIMKKY